MKRFVLGLLMLVLAAGCVPGFESLRFRIPSFQELSRSDGVAFFELSKEYKRGLPIGIRTATGTVFVTCRINPSYSADCVDHDRRSAIAGHSVSILWIDEPIFLWQMEKRAFQIEVDGRVLKGYDEMVRHYRKRLPDWAAIVMSTTSLMLLAFMVAYLALNPRQNKENGYDQPIC